MPAGRVMADKRKSTGGSKTVTRRFAAFLDDNAVHIYSTLAAVMFASNGVWFGLHYSWGILDLSGAVLFFFLSLRESAQTNSQLRRLARENAELTGKAGNQSASLEGYLTYLIELIFNNRLGYKQTERISVLEYCNGGFALVARFSANPDFCNIARHKYPPDFGVAGAALASEKGEAYDLKLPDPEKDLDAYVAYQADNWNVPKSEGKKLRMKAREYAAFTVTNRANSQVSGVIVFESTRSGVLKLDELRKAANSAEAQDIGNLLGFVDLGE
jgi:hypothetical protein